MDEGLMIPALENPTVMEKDGPDRDDKVTADNADAIIVSSRFVVKQNEEFDSAHIDKLMDEGNWDELEYYIQKFIPEADPTGSHPFLFMEVRRARVRSLINKNMFSEAESFFDDHVKPLLKLVQGGEQMTQNACATELEKEISHLQGCLKSKICLSHTYGTPELSKLRVSDYLRLYLPGQIGFDLTKRNKRDGLWDFAIQMNVKPGKPTYRCLVCSVEVFKYRTIGDLLPHLEKCPLMVSPYLLDKLELCKRNAGKKSDQAAFTDQLDQVRTWNNKRLRTSVPNIRFSDGDVLGKTITEKMRDVEEVYEKMGHAVGKVNDLHSTMGVLVKEMKDLIATTATEFSTEHSGPTRDPSAAAAGDSELKFDESLNVLMSTDSMIELIESNPPINLGDGEA